MTKLITATKGTGGGSRDEIYVSEDGWKLQYNFDTLRWELFDSFGVILGSRGSRVAAASLSGFKIHYPELSTTRDLKDVPATKSEVW